MTITDDILELGARWAAAEQRADTAELDLMTTDDFTLVGPLGFVLDKQQWLARHRTGGLVTKTLTWHDVTVREYGNAAIAVGVHTQEAEFQGTSADGSFRATHIFTRDGVRWALAGIHLSPIGAMPFQPPAS
ncbi:nuclear transport factor 2 family protein [Nocardia sp. NPDC057440]|uniref:nuclear transport factor 2 family protein n=1 Tax=Nocardia sp. NPDC057440 TaxID=3346134 RepID=UPI003672E6AA